MKMAFLFTMLLLGGNGFSQSPAESDILKLSKQIFDCEIKNQIDSLEPLLHEQCKVVNSHGEIQTKGQYVTTLRSGTFKHDSIAVEQSAVTVVGNTATMIGKGCFHMTVSGNKVHRHLFYMEVFTNNDRNWKLIALYASVLPDK